MPISRRRAVAFVLGGLVTAPAMSLPPLVAGVLLLAEHGPRGATPP